MLKDVLKHQRLILERSLNKDKIIEREQSISKSKLIKVITGPRRAGKSFFTYLYLKDKKFAYVNFDDDRLIDHTPDDIFKTLIELYGEFKIIFFDEIQNLDRWEPFVNRLYREGFDLFITGSNARLLSRELSSHLTGRSIPIEIFPFSFREYLKTIERTEIIYKEAIVKKYLNDYMTIGGFPEILVDKEDPTIYLNNLYNTIITKDIVLRYNIRYRNTIRQISDYLVSNIGNYVSYTSIKKHFGLASEHTAKNYLEYLKEAYLFLFVEAFSFKIREIKKSPRKIYCIDTGLYNALGFKFSENIGQLMENIVYIDLLRRRSYFNPNIEIYYYKTNNYEIDFLIKEGPEVKELIQVTYASEFNEISPREYRALIKVSDVFKGTKLTIITWDYEDQKRLSWFGREAIIEFKPLWKWLLNI